MSANVEFVESGWDLCPDPARRWNAKERHKPERRTKEQATMLVHHYGPERKREVQAPSTDVPQGFHSIGDVARSVTKRAILRGYAHGVLSVEATQALIDALDLGGA